MTGDDRADPAPGWPLAGDRLPACGREHLGDPGRLDETARRLDHSELAVARMLAGEGHDVVTLSDRGRREPTPDLMVCGSPVEVKCLLTRAERDNGRSAGAATVHNRLMSSVAQAAVVVMSTEGSGCRQADAAAGVRSFSASGRSGVVEAVRVVGDGYDLSWSASAGRGVEPGAERASAAEATTRAPFHAGDAATRAGQPAARPRRAAARVGDLGLGLG